MAELDKIIVFMKVSTVTEKELKLTFIYGGCTPQGMWVEIQ